MLSFGPYVYLWGLFVRCNPGLLSSCRGRGVSCREACVYALDEPSLEREAVEGRVLAREQRLGRVVLDHLRVHISELYAGHEAESERTFPASRTRTRSDSRIVLSRCLHDDGR